MPNLTYNDALTFRGINKADVNGIPFFSYKKWDIASGSSTSSCLPLNAVYSSTTKLPILNTELTYNDAKNIDNSLQTVTYFSINHLFYKNQNQKYYTLGQTSNGIKKILYQSASILSFPGKKVGLQIKPKSFEFTASGTFPYNYKLKSDKYGNIYNVNYDQSQNIDYIFYEGFNEYFDTTRIKYESLNVSYIPGITSSDSSGSNLGFAAKFSGNGYIKTNIDSGKFTRDDNYAISFFISSSASGLDLDQLILGKLNSSSFQYPFKISLSGSNCIKFSVSATSNLNATVTSSVLSQNDYNHVVCEKSGSFLKITVNNTSISSSYSFLSRPNTPFTASGLIHNYDPLYIGGFSTSSLNLSASIDEIRIFNNSLTTSNIRALNSRSVTGSLLQTHIVGNIFNQHGIAVISSPNYIFNDIINKPYNITYRSTVKTTELSVLINVPASELNMSLNKTLLYDDHETYLPFVSSSIFTPYITTIGLYSDTGDLVAIAKLAQPIKKRTDIDLNFLIRIDLDHEFNNKG